MTESYSFLRYLEAKKSVDDRALNLRVCQALQAALPRAWRARPLRVLELGCGSAAMLRRLFDWGLLRYAEYTALDHSAEALTEAERQVTDWALQNGWRLLATLPGERRFGGPRKELTLRLRCQGLADFLAEQNRGESWDLLVAHAFLDLIDLPTQLPALMNLLPAGGLFYFTIVFDGLTVFEPPIDPPFDEQVIHLYHRTMDERTFQGQPAGESRSGRKLLYLLHQLGAEILAAGPSDWVVFPGPEGYPAQEAYFLHYIVETVHQALRDHPDLDAERFAAWIARRHQQIEDGQLIYLAHQVDVAGRVGLTVKSLDRVGSNLPSAMG